MLVNTKPMTGTPRSCVRTGRMQALNGKLAVLIVRKTGELQGSHLASGGMAENISCIIVTTSRIGVAPYRAMLIFLFSLTRISPREGMFPHVRLASRTCMQWYTFSVGFFTNPSIDPQPLNLEISTYRYS